MRIQIDLAMAPKKGCSHINLLFRCPAVRVRLRDLWGLVEGPEPVAETVASVEPGHQVPCVPNSALSPEERPAQEQVEAAAAMRRAPGPAEQPAQVV